MSHRLVAFAFTILLLVGLAQEAECAAAAWFQDDLVRDSNVIAVVDILERVRPDISGAVLFEKYEFPTAPILYQSSVVQTICGKIPSEPLIIQFDGAGDRNPLEKGRYLLFLRSEGHLFTPMETHVRIENGKVFWCTKPFLRGGYGPEMGEVSLEKAILEVKALIEQYKKS